MDPNATLQEIQDIIAQVRDCDTSNDIDVDRLCELIEALDNWMTGGGFLPDQWKLLRK